MGQLFTKKIKTDRHVGRTFDDFLSIKKPTNRAVARFVGGLIIAYWNGEVNWNPFVSLPPPRGIIAYWNGEVNWNRRFAIWLSVTIIAYWNGEVNWNLCT